MFVVPSDFDIAPYNLPNLKQYESLFPRFVTEREEDELSRLFGTIFWEAFKEGVNSLPPAWIATIGYAVDALVTYQGQIFKALIIVGVNQLPPVDGAVWELQPTDRWLPLTYGSKYVLHTRPYKWTGMVAMVKPMIVSKWLEYVINDQITQAAVVKAKTQNSNAVSSNIRICQSWNAYDDQACGVRTIVGNVLGYLRANAATFDDVTAEFYATFNTYLTSQFKRPGRKNIYDL